MCKRSLIVRLVVLRAKLQQEMIEKKCLTHPKVVEISQKMDLVIVELQKMDNRDV